MYFGVFFRHSVGIVRIRSLACKPTIESKDTAKDLVAADRLECLQLKFYVESVLSDKFLSFENAAELFIFADSHCCALLKEAASNMWTEKRRETRQSTAWSEIKESKELLLEIVDNVSFSKKYPVRYLREELESAELELADGNHKALIKRLKAHRDRHSKKRRLG